MKSRRRRYTPTHPTDKLSGKYTMKKRAVMLLILTLLWFLVANATCYSNRQQEELIRSYQLAQFNLTECEDMGAGQLESEILGGAMRLSEEIEEMIARESWSQASRTIKDLNHTVALLQDRMKDRDPDGDGLSNYAEFMMYGTSWTESDSDGDGFLDGSEILKYQTDPLDYCGVPKDIPPETAVQQPCEPPEELR